jgi:hypothetical protein
MATAIKDGMRGLGLLVQLNTDRVIAVLVLVGALFLASYVGSL